MADDRDAPPKEISFLPIAPEEDIFVLIREEVECFGKKLFTALGVPEYYLGKKP